jgi:hypothetical protein
MVLELALVLGLQNSRASPFSMVLSRSGRQPRGFAVGPSSSLTRLTIRNGFFDCSALTSSRCLQAASLTFDNGSVNAIVRYRQVASSSNLAISGNPQLYFEYLSTSVLETLDGIPLLHLESISLAYAALYRFTLRQATASDPGFQRGVLFNSDRALGCAFSVPSIGNYTISFESASPGVNGQLHRNGTFVFEADKQAETLYYDVEYWLDPTPRATSTPSESRTPPKSSTPTEISTPTTMASDELSRSSDHTGASSVLGWPPITEVADEWTAVRFVLLPITLVSAALLTVSVLVDVRDVIRQYDIPIRVTRKQSYCRRGAIGRKVNLRVEI